MADQELLEAERLRTAANRGADAIVAHRDHLGADAEPAGERGVGLAEALAPIEQTPALEAERQVAVAE